MIVFNWNGVLFSMTDIGGGALGEDIPRHTHAADSYELHFIVGGKGKLITDTNSYELSSGNFFITGPGVYHGQTAERKDPVKDIFITFQAVRTDKANGIATVFLDKYFFIIEKFDSSIARQILEEYREKKADYESAVCGLSMKLFTDITRLLLPSSFSEKTPAENLYDRRFVIIEQAFLYTPDLTLTELSEKIGLCERQTQRLLKKYYGKSFREKKNESKQVKAN